MASFETEYRVNNMVEFKSNKVKEFNCSSFIAHLSELFDEANEFTLISLSELAGWKILTEKQEADLKRIGGANKNFRAILRSFGLIINNDEHLDRLVELIRKRLEKNLGEKVQAGIDKTGHLEFYLPQSDIISYEGNLSETFGRRLDFFVNSRKKRKEKKLRKAYRLAERKHKKASPKALKSGCHFLAILDQEKYKSLLDAAGVNRGGLKEQNPEDQATMVDIPF